MPSAREDIHDCRRRNGHSGATREDSGQREALARYDGLPAIDTRDTEDERPGSVQGRQNVEDLNRPNATPWKGLLSPCGIGPSHILEQVDHGHCRRWIAK